MGDRQVAADIAFARLLRCFEDFEELPGLARLRLERSRPHPFVVKIKSSFPQF